MRGAARFALAVGAIAAGIACGSRTPLLAIPVADAGDDGSGAQTGIDAGGAEGSVARDSSPSCTPQGGACTNDGQCCSGDTCNGSTCGSPTTTCTVNGMACMLESECCSGQCYHGYCGPKSNCLQNGSICSIGAQCCSEICSNDQCGAGNCAALGPSQCDTCMALSCCSQLSACLPDAACNGYLQCFFGCEADGGTGVSCGQTQCAGLGGTLATQLQQCLMQLCDPVCTSG
jgi:hypothetical protein